MQFSETTLLSLNAALTQFGEVSLISGSTSLTSRQNSQKDLHLTGNFRLQAHKRGRPFFSFFLKRKLKLVSHGSFSGDFTFYFITLTNRGRGCGIT